MKIRANTQLKPILRTVFDVEGNRIKDVAEISDTGFLHVQRAVIIPNAEPIIKSPKTKKSNRHAPMSDALIEILRVHYQPAGFVITDREGKLFTKSRYHASSAAHRLTQWS